MPVRNVKSIIVLLLFGAALIVMGVARVSLSDQGGQGAPASATASWPVGALGVALVLAGLGLLRRGYRDARTRLATDPPARTLRSGKAVAIVAGAIAAIAVVALASSVWRSQASSSHAAAPADARPPVARDGSIPAAAPDMPKSYQPR